MGKPNTSIDHFKAESGLWALEKLREIVGDEIELNGDAEHYHYIVENSLKTLAGDILKENHKSVEA